MLNQIPKTITSQTSFKVIVEKLNSPNIVQLTLQEMLLTADTSINLLDAYFSLLIM